ncbi:hypothetical protein AGOR_G00086010 [Albula goreensis]|uniref:Zinc transporter 1 n=1 Tax=Albula goreensis TaxID=1534307 RepID=A0A8T3DKD4_9TELE|nr:hypothetical protein AGOR_G00086010 [Albula goreensis]
MGCTPNRLRLLCMLSLTFGFFVVEIVVSRITVSLAMLSDSFHMLSDVIALVVALVAVRFAEKTQATNKNTFGWIRAEVMGALVNAVFLTALCFTIILEAIERFTEPHAIESPEVVIGVGAGGLLVNLLGLCLFHGHGGGGHGHSHGGHSHGNKKNKRNKMCKSERPSGNGSSVEETNNLVANCNNSPNGVNTDRRSRHEIQRNDSLEVQMNGSAPYEDLDQASLNMRGVFLHVLGDALGSVIVVVNALIFKLVWQPCPAGQTCNTPCSANNHTLGDPHGNGTNPTPGPCWVLYLDPTLCIIMVCILLYTTYPLLKESALILLQTVPKQIDVHQLNEQLRGVEGVLAVHELHIWQLAGSRIIATAHIKCHDPASYMDVAKRIKDFFHDHGIHATTIQPEFATVNSESRISLCELSCRTQCAPKLCCGASDKPAPATASTVAAAAAAAATATEKKVSDGKGAALEVINETSGEQAQSGAVSAVQVVPRQDPEITYSREVESSL